MIPLRSLLFITALFIFSSLHGQWTLQESNTSADITDIFFLEDNTGFAVGDSGIFLKTVNGGETWLKSVINPADNLKAVAATDPGTVFAGGSALYRSADGGASWTLVTDDFDVLYLVFVNASVGYAKSSWLDECESSQGYESAIRYEYFKTTDGGLTWAYDNTFGGYMMAGEIEMASPKTGYLASWFQDFNGGIHCETQNWGLLFRTDDSGATWEVPQYHNWWQFYTHSSFISDSTGYFIENDRYLMKTTNWADTITYVSSLSFQVGVVDFANEYEGYCLSGDKVYKTRTWGCVWETDLDAGAPLHDLFITPGYRAFAVGTSGVIYRNDMDPVTEPDSLYWLSHDKQEIEFPLTAVNGETRQTLALKASGNMDILATVIAPPNFLVRVFGEGDFSGRIDNLPIRAQYQELVEITFRPVDDTTYSEDLIIETTAYNDTTFLIPMTGSAIYALAGEISHDTLLCQDTIRMIATTKVMPGARLSICPGTTVLVTGKHALEVEGSLEAMGTPEAPIVFTALETDEGWNGIRITGSSADSSILECCRVEHGNVEWENYQMKGGGIFISGNDRVRISHCTITHNISGGRGGGICISGASPVIEHCELGYNHADGQGGGIYMENSHGVIRSNVFHHNDAGSMGGGIYVKDSNPLVVNNTFYSNFSGSAGGAICLSGEIPWQPARIIQNLVFNNVTDGYGGGIYFYTGKPDLFLNTITNNVALDGGGVFGRQAGLTRLYGSILYGNEPTQVSTDAAYITVYYCDIEGGWEGTGEGNIDAGPAFFIPTETIGIIESDAGLDWSFPGISPCFNLGIPDTSGYFLPAKDLAGNPRIFGGRIDMGAYEACFGVQLQDQMACAGEDILLAIVPLGGGPFSYRWTFNAITVAGADTADLLITSAGPEDAGTYRCIVASGSDTLYSRPAQVIVSTDGPPVIQQQPLGMMVCRLDTAFLSVTAEEVITFQWYRDSEPLEGANASHIEITSFTAEDAGSYRCLAINGCGETWSEPAVLQLAPDPNPYLGADTTIASLHFELVLDPGPGFSGYQWSDGSTGQIFLVTEITVYPGGNLFWVTVTSEYGCQASDTIMISYNPQGIEEIDISAEVYPNPAIGKVFVRLNNPGPSRFEVSIYNLQGLPVYRKQIGPGPGVDLPVPLEGLPGGTYVLIIRDEEGIISRKIVLL